MNENSVLGVVFLLSGLWSFAGGLFGLPMFLNSRRVRAVASLIGYGPTRLLYVVFGLLLMGGGTAAGLGYVDLRRHGRGRVAPAPIVSPAPVASP